MDDFNVPGGNWTLSALVLAIGGAALKIVRGASRETTELARDKGERGLISRQREEIEDLHRQVDEARREAKAERDTRIADRQLIARLEAANEYLEQRVRRLMRKLPDPARREEETNYGGLDELPPPPSRRK